MTDNLEAARVSKFAECALEIKRLRERAEYLRPKVGAAFAAEMKQMFRVCRDEPHEDNLVTFGSQIIDLAQVVGMEFTGIFVTFFLHYGHKMTVHMSDVVGFVQIEGMEEYIHILEDIEQLKLVQFSTGY